MNSSWVQIKVSYIHTPKLNRLASLNEHITYYYTHIVSYINDYVKCHIAIWSLLLEITYVTTLAIISDVIIAARTMWHTIKQFGW